MNDPRRKQIKEAYKMIQSAVTILETACEDEQDAFDNMPEGLQESDRGVEHESVLMELVETKENIEYELTRLEEIVPTVVYK